MDAKTNQIIIDTLKPFDPEEIGVLGSYARDEMGPESDIDISYIFPRTVSLFEIIDMKHRLEDLLKLKVDFVAKHAINKYLKPYIMQDLQVIYEKT